MSAMNFILVHQGPTAYLEQQHLQLILLYELRRSNAQPASNVASWEVRHGVCGERGNQHAVSPPDPWGGGGGRMGEAPILEVHNVVTVKGIY